nr:testis-expressed protein 2-like isoform X1 [Dermacentor andersoni]XP_054925614.1 testis-expressed protein 2-like isoform X1 [Dermacentor andersoni]
MTHRLSLSKLTGKQATSSPMPVMSFRYNPCDEDIQELQPIGSSSKDSGATQQPQQQQQQTQSSSCSSSIPGTSTQAAERSVVSTSSRDSSVERRPSAGPVPERRATSAPDLDVLDHPLANIEREPSPEPPEVSSGAGTAAHVSEVASPVEPEPTKVESSPVKDSVKDYLSKFSKKASLSHSVAEANLPTSPSGTANTTAAGPSEGTDGWFTGLKGRLTKRLEEKRHGTRLLRRDDDSKSAAATSDAAGTTTGTTTASSIVLHDDETASARTTGHTLDECKEATEKGEDTGTTRTGSTRATVQFATTGGDEGPDPDLTSWEFVEQPERPLKQPVQAQPPAASHDFSAAFRCSQTPNLTALVHAMMKTNSFLIAGVIGLLAMVLPMPSFSSGLVVGCVVSFFTFGFLWYLLVPTQERFPFEVPDYARMPPLKVPRYPMGDSSRLDANSYEGWMSQLPFESEYHIETHHMNNTQSVHLVLTGNMLRLRWPKHPVPRRAMWNEKRPEPVFVSQRHFSLTDAKVMLLPEKLARDRLWNKKYPICLLIPSEDHHVRQMQIDSSQADTVTRFNSDEDANDTVKDLYVRDPNNDEADTAAAAAPASSKDDLTSSKTAVAGKDSSQEKAQAQTNGSVSKDSQQACTSATQARLEHEVLYLFARTCREKEEWFRRFQQAIACGGKSSKVRRMQFDDSSGQLVTYEAYIEELQLRHREQQWLPSCLAMPKSTAVASLLPSPPSTGFSQGIKSETQWLNMLIGRLFYDIFTQNEWADVVRRRIQKKLNRIKVPFFMEELMVTDIHLGSQLPYIRRTSEAVVDKRGVWVDMDVTYSGAFYMTLSTKLNLMRLKRSQTEEMQSLAINHDAYDDESAASSSDDEGATADKGESSAISRDPSSATGTGKKLLELVDKIAQSRYFQQATENRYIKRKMEEVSNTPLVLTVEISHLVGTVALNIPPPPTDRVWYGFRTLPKMQLVARPKLGAKEVTIARVTERIEKMLFLEFQRIFVMPNMDDFVVPFMFSDVTES